MAEYEEGKALFELLQKSKIPLEIAWCDRMIKRLIVYRKGLKKLKRLS